MTMVPEYVSSERSGVWPGEGVRAFLKAAFKYQTRRVHDLREVDVLYLLRMYFEKEFIRCWWCEYNEEVDCKDLECPGPHFRLMKAGVIDAV